MVIELPDPGPEKPHTHPLLEIWWDGGDDVHRYGVDSVEGWKMLRANKRVRSAEFQMADGTQIRFNLPEQILESPAFVRWMYNTLRDWHVDVVTRNG